MAGGLASANAPPLPARSSTLAFSSLTPAAARAEAEKAAAAEARSALSVNEVVVRYTAVWNERDPARRRELIGKTWAEDGTYVDAHRHGARHDGIDAMIAKAQEQFPGYTLRLVSGIETHNGNVRFSWAAGGQEHAPLYLAGTDFLVLAGDGRIRSVTGFVDAAPARAAKP
jgi:hypothetical protein